jgi:small subunit ribosomal protein S35
VTSTVDLADPKSAHNVKRVLVAPLAALPLGTPEAVQRLKILAGPRWSPGFPGRAELGPDAAGSLASSAEDHGFVKIAEDRFPDGRMNRKAVSDVLERLVAAANVSR